MSLKSKILLEQTDWTRVASKNLKNFSHCKTKEVDGKFYYSPSSCKSKPKPAPPKPKEGLKPKEETKPESESIVDCEWKASEGMIFKCNSGCGEMESGDSFRDYVNRIFPEIAEKNKLDKKGPKKISFCNTTMKDVWNYKYDGKDFPGLKDKTIGKIYIDGLIPEYAGFDCKKWTNNNYFVRDFDEDKRDDKAFEMVKSFNAEYKSILDSTFLDLCGNEVGIIDNDLDWCFGDDGVTIKKDLHKNPIVRWISDVGPGNTIWYDYWKKNVLKESKLSKTKLKLRKKLNEMKITKKLDTQIIESVSKKIKSKKIEKELKSISEDFHKQNYRKFFSKLFSLEKDNYITESINEDFDKSFDVIFSGQEQEFRDRAIEFILNKLEVDVLSDLGKEIKTELESIPVKDIFKNEYDVPDAIFNAVQKISNQTSGEETGLKGIVSKSIKLDDKQLKQGVRQHLQDYMENIKNDIKTLEEKIKSSIIGK